MGILDWLFGPREPVSRPARHWIETHLRWLADEFGETRLIDSPIIEPDDRFFPEPYDGTPDSLAPLFLRVCEYMGVDASRVGLELFSNDRALGLVTADGFDAGVAAGTFHEGAGTVKIRLDRRHLETPMSAVAILAHELSHLRLLGENRVDPDRIDHELLTDLCADFFGFGIFSANATAYSIPDDRRWPGTDLWMPEYMTAPMHAYALAVIAQVRFEERPRWARHLKPSARSEFRAAAAWLERHPGRH